LQRNRTSTSTTINHYLFGYRTKEPEAAHQFVIERNQKEGIKQVKESCQRFLDLFTTRNRNRWHYWTMIKLQFLRSTAQYAHMVAPETYHLF
ncbi:hypothetical protein NECAME_12990, partial [Necator americanus]